MEPKYLTQEINPMTLEELKGMRSWQIREDDHEEMKMAIKDIHALCNEAARLQVELSNTRQELSDAKSLLEDLRVDIAKIAVTAAKI